MVTVRKVRQGMGHPISGTGGMWVASFGVVVTHVGFVEVTGEGRGWGLVVHLLETSGQVVAVPHPLLPQPDLGPPDRLPG